MLYPLCYKSEPNCEVLLMYINRKDVKYLDIKSLTFLSWLLNLF